MARDARDGRQHITAPARLHFFSNRRFEHAADEPARYRGTMFRALIAAFLLTACSGGGGGGNSPTPDPPPTAAPQVSLLFMGNSHTAVNGLPQMVAAMVRAAWPGRTVEAVEAPGWMFLEERARDAPSLALLRSRAWKFVVLQAQEYSSSGMFEYPIDGA